MMRPTYVEVQHSYRTGSGVVKAWCDLLIKRCSTGTVLARVYKSMVQPTYVEVQHRGAAQVPYWLGCSKSMVQPTYVKVQHWYRTGSGVVKAWCDLLIKRCSTGTVLARV
ncbi:hypothetical protein ACJJTC_017151 [Scirpophaga incertulas]